MVERRAWLRILSVENNTPGVSSITSSRYFRLSAQQVID